MISNKTALFDLDGTLTDPKLGITRCIAHALETLGVPVPPIESLSSWIGPPIQDSFGKLLADRDPSEAVKAVEIFRTRFTELGIYENTLYKGIPEALTQLRVHGMRLVLATSKPLPFAIRILDHFDLSHHFSSVYGSGFDGSLSDKGELIAHLISQESLKSADAIMVGDRKHDILGAARNGVRGLGVLYGYGSQEELSGAGAVALCDRPADLERSLGKLFRNS